MFFIVSSMYDFANTIRMHVKFSHQPGERFSSFSSASAILRRFPQPLHVAHRWDTEEAFVFPIEVGGVSIPHAIGRTRRVEVFAQHQTAGLLQPQPLLELQGAHRRDGLEVVMEPRDAHAQLSREALDAQWLVEVSAESPDCSGDVRGVAPLDRQVTEPGSLLSSQESVDNFPRDQRQEDRRVGRGVQEPREPHDGVQQVPIQRADGDGPHISMISRRGVTGFNEDRTDEGGGEFQAQTEVGPFLRCFQDLADAGQLDSSEKIL